MAQKAQVSVFDALFLFKHVLLCHHALSAIRTVCLALCVYVRFPHRALFEVPLCLTDGKGSTSSHTDSHTERPTN